MAVSSRRPAPLPKYRATPASIFELAAVALAVMASRNAWSRFTRAAVRPST
jgi:hypothetical protein